MAARLLKDPATINSRIFVGHLQTEDMNKHELEEHFQKYGNVVGSSINRGFGFVQFEEESSALQAIQKEHGTMFKGRRIDVRPAKKDNQNSGGGGGGGGNVGLGGGGNDSQGNFPLGQGGGNNSFRGGNNQFPGANDSFGSGNQSFGGGNKSFGPGNNQNFANDQFGPGNVGRGNANEQFPGPTQLPFAVNQPRGVGNDQFSGNQAPIQPRNNPPNDQFPGGNQNRNAPNQNRGGNGEFGNDNLNRGPGEPFASGNQNRGPVNQNRGPGNEQFGSETSGNQNQGQAQNQNQSQNPGQNQNQNPGANQNQNRGSGGNQFGSGNQNQNQNQNNQGGTQPPSGRPRGNRGGKNRNKNRDNGSGGGNNNFRDRSPINRGHLDDKGGRDWDRAKMGDRGRGLGYGRDFGDIGSRGYDDFGGLPGRDGSGFGSLSGASDYPPSAAAEKNDCEIIVVSKLLTEYAEAIEMRLKKLGLTVDLLFPNEDVPLSRVLGNIASRGCLYAVVVTHMNQEHRSLTLNILHGLPQEHRNMPVEDAISLMNRDFTTYRAGSSRSVPLNVPLSADRHPDAVQVLLNMLADNRQLTVLQYDRVLKYLEVKREEQVQVELGDAKDLAAATLASDPKQAELQSRILNILNSSKPAVSGGPVPSPVPAPTQVPPASWGAAPSATVPTTSAAQSSGITPSPLLNDPTVQKALDSLLQGNLLKSIGDQQPAASAPLFAAFPNIGRY